ncbi:MAG: FAD-binding oxidoreductase [Candidatus Obscuribacterales bacterium]|nr:FAD-binding oxidoreductase [Candidatus Obscuribacterales bacterium]
MMNLVSSSSSRAHNFVSFDGSERAQGKLEIPESAAYFQKDQFTAPQISRGAGLSYAAASFGKNICSVDHARLNKIVDFNEEELWIEVEAGISLGRIYDFLIEKKLFLATQPGHPRISVGGCIAADIHGKNQFLDGTFMNQVQSLNLFHPEHGILELSPKKNEDLFRLTCGGYGLSGNILSCRLKLKRIPSSMAEVQLKPLDTIEQLPERLKISAAASDFVLSWHDFTLKGKDFGRGFIQEGRFIAGDSVLAASKKAAEQSLDAESRGNLPIKVFNPLTIKMMNLLYGSRCGKSGSIFKMSLFDSIFPIQNSKELYFKFFGASGFHEFQAVLPEETFLEYMNGIRNYLLKHPVSITLASSKLFAGKQDLLRFSANGICFALNFERNSESPKFLAFLDKLLLECRGIPNIIKDSRLSKEIVSQAYPEYELFRSALRDFDPKRIYKSELSERLAL